MVGFNDKDVRPCFPELLDGFVGDRGTIFAVTTQLGGTIERPLLILAITLFGIVLLFELLQTGFVLSSEPLKIDFSKLNPARGIKRLFSLRLLIETAKNVWTDVISTGSLALGQQIELQTTGD